MKSSPIFQDLTNTSHFNTEQVIVRTSQLLDLIVAKLILIVNSTAVKIADDFDKRIDETVTAYKEALKIHRELLERYENFKTKPYHFIKIFPDDPFDLLKRDSFTIDNTIDYRELSSNKTIEVNDEGELDENYHEFNYHDWIETSKPDKFLLEFEKMINELDNEIKKIKRYQSGELYADSGQICDVLDRAIDLYIEIQKEDSAIGISYTNENRYEYLVDLYVGFGNILNEMRDKMKMD